MIPMLHRSTANDKSRQECSFVIDYVYGPSGCKAEGAMCSQRIVHYALEDGSTSLDGEGWRRVEKRIQQASTLTSNIYANAIWRRSRDSFLFASSKAASLDVFCVVTFCAPSESQKSAL